MNLSVLLIGDETETAEFDSTVIEIITEVGNMVLNGVVGSIGNVLKHQIDYSIPTYLEETLENLTGTINPDYRASALVVRTRFKVEQSEIEGDIMLFFEENSFDLLVDALENIKQHLKGNQK